MKYKITFPDGMSWWASDSTLPFLVKMAVGASTHVTVEKVGQ